MLAIVVPLAARQDELSGGYDGGVADDSDEIAFAARPDAQDGEAVFLIVKCHSLDHAGEDLGRCLGRIRFHDGPNLLEQLLPRHLPCATIMLGTRPSRPFGILSPIEADSETVLCAPRRQSRHGGELQIYRRFSQRQ